MTKYYVSIPFTGYCTVEVEAETKKEAIDIAWESEDLDIRKAAEHDFHKCVAEGNVCHAILNEIDVEEAWQTLPSALGSTLAEIVSGRAEAPSTRVIEVRRAKAILATVGLCTLVLLGAQVATYFALRYEIQNIGAKVAQAQPDAATAKITKRVK